MFLTFRIIHIHTSDSVCSSFLSFRIVHIHPNLRSITPTLPLVMLEAVKLMAAVCLVSIVKVWLFEKLQLNCQILGASRWT